MGTLNFTEYMILTCALKNPNKVFSFTEDDVYNRLKDDEYIDLSSIKDALRDLQTSQCVTYFVGTNLDPSARISQKPYYQITQHGIDKLCEYIKTALAESNENKNE